MIYPTINDLSKGEYNRYEIALATAKCARTITNEYVHQREEAERAASGTKDNDKPLNAMIDREVRDEKAVKIAIGRIHAGKYHIVHKDPAEQEREEQAILAGINRPYEDLRIDEDDEDDLSEDDLPEDELAEDELSDEDLPEDEAETEEGLAESEEF